ncbi:MAG: hypothetical protein DCC71_00945 [Proteobacteria bacterium]|nr:MAG: hypothetical protein DCC71_00945 [Pseudomonadota bacterium]
MRARPSRRHAARDPLPFLKMLEPDSVRFTNAFTSAPSTLMSVSAMMTGMHAYQLGRTFADFSFDPDKIRSLPQVLSERGYLVHQAAWYPYTRDRLRSVLPSIPRKHWSSGSRYREDWSNDQIIDAIERTLADDARSPRFLFAHLNMYSGQETEAQVQRLLWILRNVLTNSVLVVCSDHGFPVPPDDRPIAEWRAELDHHGHDLVLSSENIRIPLLIRSPGCVPRSIDCPVSSIDLAVSLVDLLSLDPDAQLSSQSRGRNIAHLVRGGPASAEDSQRYLRTDNRYFLQPGRLTSIVKYPWKLVLHHDDESTELENIGDRKSLAASARTKNAVAAELRAELDRSTEELDAIHVKSMLTSVLADRRMRRLRGKSVAIVDRSGWRSIEPLRALLEAAGVECRAVYSVPPDQGASAEGERQALVDTLALCDALIDVGSKSGVRVTTRLAAHVGVPCIRLDPSLARGASDWVRAVRRARMAMAAYQADPRIAFEDLRLFASDRELRRRLLSRVAGRLSRAGTVTSVSAELH